MREQTNNVLTEDFLMDMFFTCMKNDYVLAIVSEHIKKEYLPDRDFITIHKCLRKHYKEHKKAPSFSILKQMVSSNKGAAEMIDRIFDSAAIIETEQLVEQLESYIKQVRFQKTYKELGELYNNQGYEEASKKLQEYCEWATEFNLQNSEFVDVIDTFSIRFMENREKYNAKSKLPPVTQFYIKDLDDMNKGRDLRTQLTCFLAPTGVGKSHAARWIGKNASYAGGLNVLHFQLEGSQKEVLDAYSASLAECETFRYECGTLQYDDFREKESKILGTASGKLFVKSYPKFNAKVTTLDIKRGIQNCRKRHKVDLDIVIIDSIDLLNDASGRNYGENGERHKRIAVANDLKDLAADENVWIVGTYQSTIENREWLNNEENVLTEFNTAEAKGLARPMTHLITLNQSDRERKENTMRINVAKSRFFKKGEPFKIATDYDHEQFYDRERSANIKTTND